MVDPSLRLLAAGALSVCVCITSCGAPGRPQDAPPDAVPAPGPASPPAVAGAGPDWATEVSARIRDASRAFVAEGEAFAAGVPERGITGRFALAGAALGLEADTFALFTRGIGRGGALDAVGAAPTLGACSGDRVDPAGSCVRRLEYVGAGVTEWWTSSAEGFQQGWTVEVAPAGADLLVVEVTVGGAEVYVGDGEMFLQGDAGGLLTVGGLAAWDAEGTPLDARFEAAPDGFRIVVDDTNARYPVEIDPIYSTAAWTVTGEADIGAFGGSVAGAGDVNADGYDDVIVGSPKLSGTGYAFVYHGSSAGLETTAATTLAGMDSSYFGGSVAGAGDVNGDGYDDVIVGGYYYSSYTGLVSVYLGSATGVTTTGSATITGATTNYAFGYAVAAAGDVNADGYDDVIVGAYRYSSQTGRAYVYPGGAGGVGSGAIVLTGFASSSAFGTDVAGAGDVNGDGYDDVVVGAPSTSDAYVYYGGASGTSTTSYTSLYGAVTTNFGVTVTGAGDVNQDGYDDVLVGADRSSSGSGVGFASLYLGAAVGISTLGTTVLSEGEGLGLEVHAPGDLNGDGYDDVLVASDGDDYDTGKLYLYEGTSAGLDATAAQTWSGVDTNAYFGASVGSGDVNGDGRTDIVVGARGVGAGRVYVYEGTASGLPSTADTTLDGVSAEKLGSTVAGAGDVDRDGYDDVLVSGLNYFGATGRVYLYPGSADGLSATASTTLTGGDVGDSFGSSASGAGDVNGDGYDDVVIGASGAGLAYVYHGSASGPASTVATTLSATSSSAGFGGSVAGAGDVNADGYDDIVVGEPYYSSYAGRAHVFHGSASGARSTATATITGAASVQLGYSVAGAGDVNRDGYDDVIVGASAYASTTGRAYVHHGSASGVSASATSTLTGTTGSRFGVSVAGAGDVNADGYADVVVGAWGGGYALGHAYVFHGASGGVSTSVATTLTGEGATDAYGLTVAAAGDLDGDRYDDVAVGAYAYDSSAGKVYVYPGAAAGVSSTATTTFTGSASSAFGYSLANAGDVDGDGDPDLLVGAPYASSYAGYASLYASYDTDADLDGYEAADDCDDTDATLNAYHTLHVDGDGDGYGDVSTAITSCAATVSGHVADATDCDDTNAAIRPGATEVCDSADTDEDCDGLADDDDAGATGKSTVYADADGDGYGSGTAAFCDVPAGYVTNSSDCDDTTAAVSPAGSEVCDGANADEDCDGLADDADASATGQSAYYTDGDGDGFGAGSAALVCDIPSGHVMDATDCDDGVASTNPAATEVCDGAGADEDCDGLANDADASVTGTSTYYADADGDGYGGVTTGAFCEAPAGYVATATDCDDTAAASHPDAVEVCDAADADEDCDGLADDGDATPSGRSFWYVDADGDGFGTTVTGLYCDRPSGYADVSTDCDDADPADHPGAAEAVANGDDDDCDGAEVCYVDADVDGFRSTGTVASADEDCADAGEALAAAAPDCDDADDTIHAGAAEIVGNGLDEDCDGQEVCYVDGDGDGYRVDDDATALSVDLDCTDPGEAGPESAPGDCDDGNIAFHPDADEGNCIDRNDYNCDGSVGYADADGDGFAACEECDDSRTAVNPDAAEVCNGMDDDCEGTVDEGADDAPEWFADADADGYTDPAVSVLACDEPEGYLEATADDCDDADPSANPEGTDLPDDGVDQDCDGADATRVDTGAADDTAGDTGDAAPPGCGCASPPSTGGPGGAAWMAIAAAMLLARRRPRFPS